VRVDPRGAPCDNPRMRKGLPTIAALAAFVGVVVVGAASLVGMATPAAAAPVLRRPAPPVLDDLIGPRAGEAARALGALGALPTAGETAAFAAGRVAVAVVFVESDGSVDRSTENWTRLDPANPGDRRANVLAKVQAALTWWNDRSPDGSLEAFLPAAGQYGKPRTVTTRFEPISRPVSHFAKDYRLSDAGWRWEIMGKLGYAHDRTDDSPLPERAYADKVRRKTGADWAFVLYVVDSLRDADGAFRDEAIAYTADLYGPYTVLTYDNDSYGFSNFDAVLAHEMGHVFGALDEYAPPRPGYASTGGLTSGYLGVRNRNAVKGGTTDLPCIMRGSQATLDAFALGELCPSTVGQTGLRDGDADTHPNVVDTHPRFDSVQSTVANGGVFTVTGSVREKPWPRGTSSIGIPFRHDISIFVPHDLQFRVDGGEWLPLVAVDGRFDEPVEKWKLTTGPLAAGTHTLEVQGTTGETAGFTKELSAGL
jgi:hypothetical protein